MTSVVKQSVMDAAFQRVLFNHGGAGVDGITVDAFGRDLDSSIGKLRYELLSGSYQPLPLLRLIVDKGKGNGEGRPLSIPAVRDRVAQAAAFAVVGPVFEAEFETCSFAYRKGRSVRQAVYLIRKYYDEGYRWVVEADIDAYFDNVDHGKLLRKVKKFIPDKRVVSLIEKWIKVDIWDGETVYPLTKGIPQGSVISPVLSNLFLDELDERLTAGGFKLVRFADDFIIQCRDRKSAEKALELTDTILDDLSLELDESEITNFEHGFKFLGVTFLKSMAVVPFDKPKKVMKILHYPKPLNMVKYFQSRVGSEDQSRVRSRESEVKGSQE